MEDYREEIEKTVHILIHYVDGTVIPLEVNRDEFTNLCAKATELHDEKILSSEKKRHLTLSESNAVLSSRQNHRFIRILCYLLFIPLIYIMNSFSGEVLLTQMAEDDPLVLSFGRVFSVLGNFMIAIIVLFVVFRCFGVARESEEDLLTDNEVDLYRKISS